MHKENANHPKDVIGVYIDTDISNEMARILSNYNENRVQRTTPEEDARRHKSPPQGDRVSISEDARALAAAEKNAEAETVKREQAKREADEIFEDETSLEDHEAETLADDPSEEKLLPQHARGFGKTGDYF